MSRPARARGTLSRLAALALVSLACATRAFAVRPILWTESPAGLLRGEANGVALTSQGALILAPQAEEMAPPAPEKQPAGKETGLPRASVSDPIVWSETLDGQGNLILGTGHSGRVVKISPRGGVSELAQTPEPEVTAVLASRSGAIYAATAPNGAVYRIGKDGLPALFFEPRQRYIWTLAEDAAGNLYAGTGERGKVFRISPEGEGTVLFDSRESHITTLTFDRDGTLIAGSDGSGMVYRIDGQEATVLYDSGYREISDLAVDGAGQIYASAVAAGVGEIPAPAPRIVVRSPEGEMPVPPREEVVPSRPESPSRGREHDREPLEAEFEGGSAVAGSLPRTQRERGGAVFRILPSGAVDEVWRSSEEVPYSLLATRDGLVYVGAGEPARLLRLEEKGRALALARFPQAQITDLLEDPAGRIFAATSNSGSAYRIERELGESGTYLSPVTDGGARSRWGRIRWEASVGPDQKVEIQTRSGNSSLPDETWSAWSPAYPDLEGSEIISPPARYIQWKTRLLRSKSASSSPTLRSVTVTYLPQNLPPRIRELRLLTRTEAPPPGDGEPRQAACSGAPTNSGASKNVEAAIGKEVSRDSTASDSTASKDEAKEGSNDTADPKDEGADRNGPGNREATTGNGHDTPAGSGHSSRTRVLVWHAEDPNGDQMTYRMLLQREGEDQWTTVGNDLRESTCLFDESAWPEGRYRLKVIASDASSNYPSEALQAETIAESVVLDLTPPVLEIQSAKGSRPLRVRASDALSPIAAADIMTGDRTVTLARPADGVLDSRTEMLEIDVPQGIPLEDLTLRVRDAAGNEASLVLALAARSGK